MSEMQQAEQEGGWKKFLALSPSANDMRYDNSFAEIYFQILCYWNQNKNPRTIETFFSLILQNNFCHLKE